nr:uncharacterized protein LOC124494841 [Dermatophagoides farinae]
MYITKLFSNIHKTTATTTTTIDNERFSSITNSNNDNNNNYYNKHCDYPFLAAIIHRTKKYIICTGVVVGKDIEILVEANCVTKIIMNEANYFIYIGHTNWSEHGSLDKESVFDINEIILHPMNYNENGTQQYYGPMDDIAIVKIISSSGRKKFISRALLLSVDTIDVLHDCKYIGWMDNDTKFITIDATIINKYDDCQKYFKDFNPKTMYCLQINNDCKIRNGHFYGPLICSIESHSFKINITLSITSFVIEKCSTLTGISFETENLFISSKLLNFQKWINEKVKKPLYIEPNSFMAITTQTEEIPIYTTTTAIATAITTTMINGNQIKSMTKQPRINQSKNIDNDVGGWKINNTFHYLALDRINWVPCIIFFILMFMTVSIFALLECAFV